ncbi:uncharacterized protein [Salvelinus alpinus]|uniref:uncharacterized protein isoform X2 n=1 Tax=Salvelinus alpinus TaxID=8036 RepID=UPI0039FCD754
MALAPHPNRTVAVLSGSSQRADPAPQAHPGPPNTQSLGPALSPGLTLGGTPTAGTAALAPPPTGKSPVPTARNTGRRRARASHLTAAIPAAEAMTSEKRHSVREQEVMRMPGRWSVPTVWSWTGDVSEWTFPSPRGPTPLRLASTWADPHIMMVMVEVEVEESETVAAVVEGGGVGTRTTDTTIDGAAATTVDTIGETEVETGDMTDMTSTTSTVAGALPLPTTVDTGHVPGLAHTAHDDTNKLPSRLSFPFLRDPHWNGAVWERCQAN